MKKMRNNRRGFTLVEIIIVVGIVVILSSAAFLGVAVTIDRANNAQNKLRREGAANFEHDAWIKVNSINLGAADFYELQTHTPEATQAPTPTPDPESEGNGNDVIDDTTGDNTTGDNGDNKEEKTTVVEDKDPVVDPVVTTSTNPHIANTYRSTNPTTNASGSSVSKNSDVQHDINYVWNAARNANDLIPKNTKITTTGSISAGGSKIEEVYITVPSGTKRVEAGDWRYTVEKIDETHYKIYYSAAKQDEGHYQWSPPFTNLNYSVYEEYSDPNISSSSGVVVSEYSTSK